RLTRQRPRLGADGRVVRRIRRHDGHGAPRAGGRRGFGTRRVACTRGRHAARVVGGGVVDSRTAVPRHSRRAGSHGTRALRARPTTGQGGGGMIEDKAKDLGRLIGQSSEYQAVKRSSDALNEDKDTVTLLQKMEQLRVDAQRMMQRGERPSEEMERQLDTLLNEVQGRAAYQRLLVAQENFDKIMGRVNDWILEGIERGATSSIITLG